MKHFSPDATSKKQKNKQTNKTPGPRPGSKLLRKRNSNDQLSRTFLPGQKERPPPGHHAGRSTKLPLPQTWARTAHVISAEGGCLCHEAKAGQRTQGRAGMGTKLSFLESCMLSPPTELMRGFLTLLECSLPTTLPPPASAPSPEHLRSRPTMEAFSGYSNKLSCLVRGCPVPPASLKCTWPVLITAGTSHVTQVRLSPSLSTASVRLTVTAIMHDT